MDFHSLARKDLQALCKKNKIPANQTNLAMADALKSLKSIEWDEDLKQKLMPQSADLEIENHCSPLPRSRRVTALSADVATLSLQQENQESNLKKDALIIDLTTPSTNTTVRRSQRVKSTVTKKTADVATIGTTIGAAGTRRTTRNTAKKVADVAEVNADVVEVKTRGRTTRQSSRRLPENVSGSVSGTVSGRTRVTRNTAKMMSLDQDENECVETELAPLKEVETIAEIVETETEPLKEIETIESEIETVESEVETIEIEASPVKQVEIGTIENEKEVGTIEIEASPVKEADINVSNASEMVAEPALEEKLISVEEAEEQNDLKELLEEYDAVLVSDEKIESVEELNEDIAELGNDIFALELDNKSDEEIKEDEIEKKVEEINEMKKDLMNESTDQKVEQTDLADSPIRGIISEPVIANNNENIIDSSIDIVSTLEDNNNNNNNNNNNIIEEEICMMSPVRPPVVATVDKMLDSVVRHFAKASIHDSKSNIKANKPENINENNNMLIINENNNNKGKDLNKEMEVDLNGMSLRKLKAIYKEKLVVEGRRPALAELKDNFIV